MIVSVWSSYGHRFMGTNSPEYESCMTCGAMFELRKTPDGPSDGEYVAADGSEPIQCTGDTGSVHGYMGEKYCMECTHDDGPCEHERATDDCNCLFCSS